MTAAERTAALLRPWLGSDFVARHEDMLSRMALGLLQFVPGREGLHLKVGQLDTQLFMAVRDDTSGRMILRLDTGAYMRVRVGDFSIMADELLYILLENLPATPANYLLLREYSLRHGSLSALRALYEHYESHQSPDEYHTVIRIIKTCHPPFRWRQWLH